VLASAVGGGEEMKLLRNVSFLVFVISVATSPRIALANQECYEGSTTNHYAFTCNWWDYGGCNSDIIGQGNACMQSCNACGESWDTTQTPSCFNASPTYCGMYGNPGSYMGAIECKCKVGGGGESWPPEY
jgi:hypothetical protein